MSRIADREDGDNSRRRRIASLRVLLCVCLPFDDGDAAQSTEKHHLSRTPRQTPSTRHRDLIKFAPFAAGELSAPQPRRARWLSFSKIAQTGEAACHWLLGHSPAESQSQPAQARSPFSSARRAPLLHQHRVPAAVPVPVPVPGQTLTSLAGTGSHVSRFAAHSHPQSLVSGSAIAASSSRIPPSGPVPA